MLFWGRDLNLCLVSKAKSQGPLAVLRGTTNFGTLSFRILEMQDVPLEASLWALGGSKGRRRRSGNDTSGWWLIGPFSRGN